MNAYHDGTVPLSDREGEPDERDEPRPDAEDAQAARQASQEAPGAPAGQLTDSELDQMAEDAARRQEEELVEMLTELVFGLQRLRPGSYWPGDAAINRWLDEAALADVLAAGRLAGR